MDFLSRLHPGPQPLIIRWGLTAGLVSVAFAVRYVIGDNAGPYASLVFIPPIVASALLFGRGAGIFAIAASVALIAPLLDWNSDVRVHVAALALFVLVASCLVFVAASLHRALDSAHKARESTALLLDEMSHRVKNKFAVISSIIALQGRQSSPEVRKALENVAHRVQVIASVHNYLQLSRHDGHIDMREYLVGLCESLQGALDSSERTISLTCTSARVLLPPDKALAVGLLVNELVTNAFKYAFGKDGGTVDVSLSDASPNLVLEVSDTGRGYPAEPQQRLGTRLVLTFAEQLGGTAIWKNDVQGCVVEIKFPIKPDVTSA